MNLYLSTKSAKINASLQITGSKSETNRLLLLQALYPSLVLENVSESDDSVVMAAALQTENTEIDIHHAGTAMRFLTAYFAVKDGNEVILTGSKRMKERPIKILVEALQQLGITITYTENEGFPPIKITGKTPTKNGVTLPADVSSQYISALMLVAPSFENGLTINLVGTITSVPYLKMTLALLTEIGVVTSFEDNIIHIGYKPEISQQVVAVESDWSSASYHYALIALSEIGSTITLSTYKPKSLQGDAILVTIYEQFGVTTTFKNDTIIISKTGHPINHNYNFQLNNAPDIAQTIAVTCFGLGLGCYLTGLHTLKIKETDRLEALKTELSKLGAKISVTHDSLTLLPQDRNAQNHQNISIDTYNDHRMAMAFAPLALKYPIIINDAEVVSKSYPTFWEDLSNIGITSSEI